MELFGCRNPLHLSVLIKKLNTIVLGSSKDKNQAIAIAEVSLLNMGCGLPCSQSGVPLANFFSCSTNSVSFMGVSEVLSHTIANICSTLAHFLMFLGADPKLPTWI